MTDHPDWLDHLDSPTDAPAWPKTLNCSGSKDRVTPAKVPVTSHQDTVIQKGVKLGSHGESLVEKIIETITTDLIGLEDRLNQLDSGSGDGDCGSTLAAGARSIKDAMSTLSFSHPLALFQELASLAENMGGSSGGIYSILLTSAASAFQDRDKVEAVDWVRSLRSGLDAVMLYGGASPGDRTMVKAVTKKF